jgi:ABC-2 type transport system permease protein
MQRTLVIAKRELSALFFSPIAYLVLGVFALVSSLFFWGILDPGAQASMRWEFNAVVWLMAFIVPALSMRLVTEEMRSGTIELLMTAPVNDGEVIVGKWLGGVVFLLALLVPLVAHIIILELSAAPDYGPIFTGLLGLLLVGAFYLAIGTFASTLTDSQVIAFVITVLITGVLSIGVSLLSQAEIMPGWSISVMGYIGVNQQYSDFAMGLIDIRNFVYFLSGIAVFLFAAVKLLESRRWR